MLFGGNYACLFQDFRSHSQSEEDDQNDQHNGGENRSDDGTDHAGSRKTGAVAGIGRAVRLLLCAFAGEHGKDQAGNAED